MNVKNNNKINQLDNKALLQIRQQMMNFALLQIKNAETAEDMVQEALVNALKNSHHFQGISALKTWIFAILKNKIIDYLRQKDRFVLESDLLQEEEENSSFFNERQHWKEEESRKDLTLHDEQIYSKQFWLIFEACLTHLPAKQAQVFMMREYLELDSDEVCANLEISTTALYTLLHRARLQLQHCLSTKIST